nr:hypothetical protein [Candidatus Babeliales bacterium]
MVINRFKQYFRKITFFGLIAWCVAIQATTGIFKDLSTYNHAYTPQIERFKKLANHGQKLLPNLTDLSAQQKTLLAKHLQTIQTTTLGHININQLTNNAKTMINIPLMSLLQFAPWLLYHNFVLCSEIKRTYEADKTYWDAELKKPKPKDPATVSLIKQLKPKDFLYYSPTINKSGTLTEQILINFYVDEQKQIIQNHYMDMYSDSIAEMIHTFFIEQILQTAIETEKKFKAQGYETFFHARRWNWHFVNDICNLITNIFYPEQYHANKHMLRFRSPHEDIATLYQYRKQLVEHGVIGNVDSTFGIKGADG